MLKIKLKPTENQQFDYSSKATDLINDFFLTKHSIKTGKDGKAILEKLFASEGTGIMLHERMINLPPQVAVPLHDALRLDVEWLLSSKEAADNKDAQKLAPHFKVLQFNSFF